MTADLVALRVRVATAARPPSPPPEPRNAPRHVTLVHVEANDHGHMRRAVAVDLDDGVVTGVFTTDGIGPGAAPGVSGVAVPDVVLTAHQFGRHVTTRCGTSGAALVAFDMLGTVGALGVHLRRAKGGGVSMALVGGGWLREDGTFKENHFAPRVRIDGPFFDWIAPRKRRRRARAGPFVDLRVLGGVLGCNVEAPGELAASLAISWPEGDDGESLLAETLALVEVWRRLVGDLSDVAPGLPPQAVFSAGSLVRYALRSAGMCPPAESTATLSPRAIGACAAAYFGGITRASIVRRVAPGSYVDVNRTYAATFGLLGLTPHLGADHFEERPVSASALEAFLRDPDLRAQLDNRAVWRRWATTFVRVRPRGETVPHHRQVGAGFRFVVAPLDLGGGTVWVHALDLVAGALAGETIEVVDAFAIDAVGDAPTLAPVRMASGAEVELTRGTWGAAHIAERELARAIDDPLVAARREALAKACAVVGCFGLFGEVNRLSAPPFTVEERVDEAGKVHRIRKYPRTVVCEAIGPTGEALSVTTRTPQRAGQCTLWHLGAAVPAAARALIALVSHDVEAAGGEIGAVVVDALLVYGLSGERLRELLGRFDRLLYPQGGFAFKEENESLSKPTLGVVLGVGKVVLGREEGGRFRLVRSTDTAAGEHVADPSGTGDVLADGRSAWMALLEERLFDNAIKTGRVALPRDVPGWVDQPVLYPRQAGTLKKLRSLREQAGDETLMPGVRFLSAGGDEGPVVVGVGRDLASWRTWPWRADGRPCRVAVVGADGELVESEGTGRTFVVPTIRAWFASWLRERDGTLEGPPGERRRPVLVRSHPALVQYVGRDRQEFGAAAEDRSSEPLLFGVGAGVDDLLAEAAAVGSSALAAAGVSTRTAERAAAGVARPTARTVKRLAAAVHMVEERCCEGPGCSAPITSLRRDARFCGDACRKAAARAATEAPSPPGVVAARPAGDSPVEDDDLAAALDRLRPLVGGANLATSPKVPTLVGACLAAGADPEEIAGRIEADGPLRGRSPVGILAARLEALAAVLPRETAERRAARKQAVVRHAHRLATLVCEGAIPRDLAAAEVDAAYVGAEHDLAASILDLEAVPA